MQRRPEKPLALLSLFIFITYGALAQTVSTEQYIDTYKSLAEEEMQRTGVPAAISLAQGIVETDSGNGWLVQHSNNHFGVKCKNTWTGKTILYDDDRKNECFRKYDNAQDSWRDHSDFLKNNVRYAFLFRLDPLDYKDWAYGLKKAGYATSKTYAERLISTIEQYDLEQYSRAALGTDTIPRENSFSGMLNKVVKREEDEYNAAHPRKKAASSPAPAPVARAYPEGVFRINDREVVYAAPNASLVTIAAGHHLKLRKLLRYNELDNDEALPENRLIYLQQKPKEGKETYHTVRQGETMRDIAQAEGIRLKWLYKRNRMREGAEPLAGERLYLQGYAPRISERRTEERGMEGGDAGSAGITLAADTLKPKGTQKVLISRDTAAPKRHWPAASLEDAPPRQSGTQKNTASADERTKPAYHTVRRGETLYGLSKKYGVGEARLREWNHLEGNEIKVGQKLIIAR